MSLVGSTAAGALAQLREYWCRCGSTGAAAGALGAFAGALNIRSAVPGSLALLWVHRIIRSTVTASKALLWVK